MAELDLKNVRGTLRITGKDIEEYYKQKLDENNVNASGNLKDDVMSSIQVYEDGLTLSIHLHDYWKNIEYGREKDKGFPNVSAIEKWVKEKPVKPRTVNGITPTDKQLTYLIGRKIKEDGIDPKPILEESINEAMEDFDVFIGDSLQTDVDDSIRSTLGKLKSSKYIKVKTT